MNGAVSTGGRLLIAGCGYVGVALGLRMAAAGYTVFGLRRRSAGIPPPIQPISADLSDPRTLRLLPRWLDAVVYAGGPDERTDRSYRAAYVDGLQNLLAALRNGGANPKRLLFCSSTRVYGQTDGSWVDEESKALPVGFAGHRLLEGERVALHGGYPATVIRFGGIYGPDRTRLIARVRTGAARLRAGPAHFTNRIHRDDCAGVLEHLIALDHPAPLYLGVDSAPADTNEVLEWLAGQLGVRVLPAESDASGERLLPETNKRCRNARLLGSGYRFRYPTYREGYGALLE